MPRPKKEQSSLNQQSTEPPTPPKSLETVKPKKKKNSEALKRKFDILAALEAKGTPRDPRKCIRRMRYDEQGEPVYCERYAMVGTTVCPKHGGNSPQVKKAAAERMLGLLERKVERLNEISEQNTHMPSALGATQAMINRVMGKVGDGPKASNVGPTIQIGIGFSPGDKSQVSVGVQQLLEPVIEVEPVDIDDSGGK